MSDAIDLRDVLRAWPYDPDRDSRLVRAPDGREILQVRTVMGIEQYELEGRPDGERPYGRESALEYHLDRLARARVTGEEDSFGLTREDCRELFAEGTLYYYRYLNLFQLQEWQRTARDTARNLRLFDLVHRYAHREEDRNHLEKWRPYILRINAIASAMMEIGRKDYDHATHHLHQAIERIESLPELDDDTFRFERERSLLALRELLVQLARHRPVSRIERLERELKRAVEDQAFERAAQLRDRIRALRGQPAQ